MKIETSQLIPEVENIVELMRLGTPKKEIFKDFKIPLLEFLAAVAWFRSGINYQIESFAVFRCNYSSSISLPVRFGDGFSTSLTSSWYSETFDGVLRNLAYQIIFIYGNNLFDITKDIKDCKNFKTVVKQKSKNGDDGWQTWKRALKELNSQVN